MKQFKMINILRLPLDTKISFTDDIKYHKSYALRYQGITKEGTIVFLNHNNDRVTYQSGTAPTECYIDGNDLAIILEHILLGVSITK